MAVRVSNSADARPQIGIASADVVIETLAEGGTTRLIPIFHCSSAVTTGPVRSARIDDSSIVDHFTKLFGYSGANPRVQTELETGGLTLVTEATPGDEIYRDPAGSTDVNSVRANLAGLRNIAQDAGVARPTSPFRFGDVQSPRVTVSTITLGFGSTSVEYRWRSGAWSRSQDGNPFRDASGRNVTANNVLVQEVNADASTWLFDSAGAPSPNFDLVGSGRAFLFRNGKLVRGRWTDAGSGAPVFKMKSGALMKLAPGRTWLEMVPSQTGDLTGTIAYQ